MDMSTISAALGSLKAVGEIANSLIKTKNLSEIQAAAIDLNHKVIDAQLAVMKAQERETELLGKMKELEAQIASMNNWEKEKTRYQLASPVYGGLVYALLKSRSEGVNPHYLCTTCYEQGKKTILQGKPGARAGDFGRYHCPVCKTEVVSQFYGTPQPAQYFEDITPQ